MSTSRSAPSTASPKLCLEKRAAFARAGLQLAAICLLANVGIHPQAALARSGVVVPHADRGSRAQAQVPGTSLRPTSSQTPLVYVSDQTSSVIDVFEEAGDFVGEIRKGIRAPVGLFVDSNHNLWVANGGDDDVLVFPRGATSASERLDDPNGPHDVTQCPDGTVYVADASGAGGVGVYPSGRRKPKRRLQPALSGTGGLEDYVTCDARGNVFATGFIGASPAYGATGWMHGRQSGYRFITWNAGGGITATSDEKLLIVGGVGSGPGVNEFNEAGRQLKTSIGTNAVWAQITLFGDVLFGAVPSLTTCASVHFPSGAPLREYQTSNLMNPQGVAIDPGSSS